MLTLTAVVRNVFPTASFTDKETGAITKAGHKVQLEYKEPVKSGGERIVFRDLNVKGSGGLWQPLLNKKIHVQVAIYVNGTKADLYIPEGSQPYIAKEQS